MSLETYTLTVHAHTAEGDPISGARVTARLTRPDYTPDGGVFPTAVSATADADGIAVLELVSNLVGSQDSRYTITVRNTSGKFLASETIQMPEADTTLAQLVEEQPVTTESQTAAAISAALAEEWATGTEPGGEGTQSAREWAESAEATVQSAITDIENARDSALTTIDTAETDAVTAVNNARDQGVQAVQDARDQGVVAVESARDDAVNTINDLVTQAEAARDAAQGFRNESEGFKDTAQIAASNAGDSETAAAQSAQSANEDANRAEAAADELPDTTGASDLDSIVWSEDAQALQVVPSVGARLLAKDVRRGTEPVLLHYFANDAHHVINPADATGLKLNLEDIWTFTRSTKAWGWVLENGSPVLKEFAAGEPRFVVDPATGESLGYLAEGQATNKALNSFSPATQTVSAVSGQHTVSMFGSGSVDVSGATDGAFGTAQEGSPLTFTPSASQDVTLTVNGTVTVFQLEAGEVATSPIETGASAVTRNADDASQPKGDWHTPEGGYVVTPDTNLQIGGSNVSYGVGHTYGSVKFYSDLAQAVEQINQFDVLPQSVRDLSINNNDGMNTGARLIEDGPNENMRGALGFDLDNNESNEHVDTGTDVGDPQQYTVEFWVNTADPDIDGNNNFRELVDGARVTLEQDGTISFRTPGVGGRTTSSAIQFDQWEHVACVYDQVDRIIYINGQEDVRENVGSGTINLATLLIGFQVPGYMTEVRIWNTARTQQQIADNMNTRINGGESGLVGYWPLNEGLQ